MVKEERFLRNLCDIGNRKVVFLLINGKLNGIKTFLWENYVYKLMRVWKIRKRRKKE